MKPVLKLKDYSPNKVLEYKANKILMRSNEKF